MPELGLAYTTAFALGAAHALEVDHMAAVTAFVGHRPRWRTAVGFGLFWGLGHALAVLVAGTALAWSNWRLPPAANGWAELGVGLMLVALGIWALRAAARLHLHGPAEHGGHAHLHTHAAGRGPHRHEHPDQSLQVRRHRHLSTVVGALHGLAGTAPVVALVPVTLLPGKLPALMYLGAFGAGTMLAMGGYAALAAWAVSRLAATQRWARAVARATALASLVVGLWWIAAAAAALAIGVRR